MQKAIITFACLFFVSFSAWAQDGKYSVSGGVKDTETGETLIGATVFAPQQNVGTVTNEYGFYSLNLASSASEQIIYSYVGYTD
ncbi:MAG: carboxypeptidase-like regulatory domain-containing protein, partial [Saprospiraceae bacterium]|nr:carboxypeptidase-like regulatory domain-containing protein [Saprospiraceae bacterium]